MKQLIATLMFAVLVAATGCSELSLVQEAHTASAPSGSLATALGETLVNAQNTTIGTDEVEAERIALYFSAMWCPPCRNFTPLLVDAYNELQAEGKPFEVIFVSADRSADAMQQYMVDYEMPWLAIPFDADARQSLPQQHRVRGIPSLVILDSEGNVINRNAVMDVRDHGADAFDRW